MKKLILFLLVSIILVVPVIRAAPTTAGLACDAAEAAGWHASWLNWACGVERWFDRCTSAFGNDGDDYGPPTRWNNP